MKGKSLNKCNALVPWDPFLSVCIQKVCECLRNKQEQECKCVAALNYASQCNALNQQTVDISSWRVDLGCGKISIINYRQPLKINNLCTMTRKFFMSLHLRLC
jgi:C8 domain